VSSTVQTETEPSENSSHGSHAAYESGAMTGGGAHSSPGEAKRRSGRRTGNKRFIIGSKKCERRLTVRRSRRGEKIR